MITNFKLFENKDEEYVICIKKDDRRSWITVGKQYKLMKHMKKSQIGEDYEMIRIRTDNNRYFELRSILDGRLNPVPYVSYYCYPYDDVLFSNETIEQYNKRMTETKFDL